MSLEEKPNRQRTNLEVIADAMRHNAIQNALNNVNDDEMTSKQYDEAIEKAECILKDAMHKIMWECDFFGDESIIQESNINIRTKRTVSDFFHMLTSNIVEDIDNELNGTIILPSTVNTTTFQYKFKELS